MSQEIQIKIGRVPVKKNWHMLGYMNGLFIAVSREGDVMISSPDGIEWKKQNFPKDMLISSLCYGKDKYIGITKNHRVVYSNDLNVWNISETAPKCMSICYGNNQFIAIAESPACTSHLVISYDGDYWEKIIIPTGTWRHIFHNEGVFVIRSLFDDQIIISDYLLKMIYTSVNDLRLWKSMSYGNETFVAVSDRKGHVKVASNYNLVRQKISETLFWDEIETNFTKFINYICFGNGLFVAVGENSDKFLTSNNGIDWKIHPLIFNAEWKTVCYGDGKFVALATNDKRCFVYIP